MRISQNGINLITKFEGFSAKPYICSGGKVTIGYGNTYYPDGTPVLMTDEPVTKKHALDLFKIIVSKYENSVLNLVKVKLNQNQFDALVSFTYNVGVANLYNSTLLKKVNANPNDKSIAIEFDKWIKAKGKVLQGLINRRKAESDLYFKPLS